jgi:hypothetical protein
MGALVSLSTVKKYDILYEVITLTNVSKLDVYYIGQLTVIQI